MAKSTASRTIRAPREEVFDAVADIERYAEMVPAIAAVEFVGDQRLGPGTRFRETRQRASRQATIELEVTEYEWPARVRLVADERGSTRDTTFTCLTSTDGTELHLTLDVRPRTIRARLINRFARRAVHRELVADLDALAGHFRSDRSSDR